MLRGLSRFRFLWEEVLIPLAESMIDGVERAVEEFEPAVVVADREALAGALVARRFHLRWATSATSWVALADPFGGFRRVGEWVVDRLARLQQEAGLVPVDWPDRSPDLILVYATRALIGDVPLPAACRLVGPALVGRVERTPFPWSELRDGPRILASIGTVNPGANTWFVPTVLEALDDASWQAVLVAPMELVPHPPPNVLVRPYVPQLSVLDTMNAVLCHAGANVTCESLSRGLPLVVVPIKDDQMHIAGDVVRAGAGIRARFGRVTPHELRTAVETVLTDPSYREAAGRIRTSFEEAGGAVAAADALERLTIA